MQISRVTKVVKGGKQLSFRAVVVTGNKKGQVGVGVASANEVIRAVAKAVTDANRGLISLPLTKNRSIPHVIKGRAGASHVVIRPANEGTGVVAGGATRIVLELAGFRNVFGKQLEADNPLNNVWATLKGLKAIRTLTQVANVRNVEYERLVGKHLDE